MRLLSRVVAGCAEDKIVKLDPVEVRAALRSPRGTTLRGGGSGAEIELSFPPWP